MPQKDREAGRSQRAQHAEVQDHDCSETRARRYHAPPSAQATLRH